MKRHLPAAVLLLSLGVAPSAVAAPFAWCSILDLVPRVPADFEPVAARLRSLEGCTIGKEDDTPDELIANCMPKSEGSTPEPVWIYLVRETGFGISLLASTFDMHNLDRLRACIPRTFEDGNRFSPESIVYRDQLVSDGGQTRISLINAGPNSVAHVYTASGFNAGPISRAYQSAFLGMALKPRVSSEVRIEGGDPSRVSAKALVGRYVAQGGKYSKVRNPNGNEPLWCLKGGSSVQGVGSVCVQGLFDHIWSVTYRLRGSMDFNREVSALKRSLGRALSDKSHGCRIYWWQSGAVLVRASYCSEERGNITYINSVASAQRDALEERGLWHDAPATGL